MEKLPAYHPDTNAYLGDVTVVNNEKVYPAWLKALPGFLGDAEWVHAQEGHAGGAYWPAGQSGVTLDPGVDLGYVSIHDVAEWFKGILSFQQLYALERVQGVTGQNAKNRLDADPVLKAIRITRPQAGKVFPVVAKKYWTGITRRFPKLLEPNVPPEVHTAFLSLAYNRGFGNKGLEVLRAPLNAQNWPELAAAVANMQQDHALAGIRRRRQEEGALIARAA